MFYNEIPGFKAVEYTSYIFVYRYGRARLCVVSYAVPDNNGVLKTLTNEDKPNSNNYNGSGIGISGGTNYYPAYLNISNGTVYVHHYNPGSGAGASSNMRYYGEIFYFV